MKKKSITRIILLIFFFIVLIFYFSKLSKKKDPYESVIDTIKDNSYSSNIMKNVSYFAKDSAGNIYQIDAKIGEIDINNNNTIFLTDVTAIIELKNSNNIKIKSDFGKYNINNYDT
ncbi:LPS export ABC transporter periplasmic protein LptC, partial [Candidatus Pelagibacter sp.]|nr:LPS export ABC transporter periplasmic protein LptC [Candidatus Pelagibacter sp.]